MENLSYLYRRLRDAADQTMKGRLAILVLVIPGAPEWATWRDTPAGREFLTYVRDVLFRETRFANVPLCVFASGALVSGGGSSQFLYQSGWALQNVTSCESALPDDLAIFTDEPAGGHDFARR